MSTAAVGAMFFAPVIASQASLCNLLVSVLLPLCANLGHLTVDTKVNIGVITMVYIQYTALVSDPKFYQMCLHLQKAL